LPTLSTTAVSTVTSSSAVSGGNISSDGGAAVTERGVVWSTQKNPTVGLSTKTTNGSGMGEFTATITGLDHATLYYVRAYATNSVGTAYGEELTFTTEAVLPTVVTTAASSVTSSGFSTGGNVTDDGGASITARGVVWSTSEGPTVSLPTKTDNGSGTGVFTSFVTGLQPNTVYYVRAYATNSKGTAYGEQITVRTDSKGGTEGVDRIDYTW
ncbi:MAG: hypothetical protein J6V75_00100, partial [Bacteroidaceae bacterium]|nr:hypothetical protein [Bacteroidaceae bacterium]